MRALPGPHGAREPGAAPVLSPPVGALWVLPGPGVGGVGAVRALSGPGGARVGAAPVLSLPVGALWVLPGPGVGGVGAVRA
ncbi:hypothetical protein GCM10017752_61460 [Streptomyces roseoviridis]